MSPVERCSPSSIEATYSLSRPTRPVSFFVPFSTPISMRPEAKGSSVPACPILRTPVKRRNWRITVKELIPFGLSMSSNSGKTDITQVLILEYQHSWVNHEDSSQNEHQDSTNN